MSEKIIDLGQFGKFSKATLIANRRLSWYWKRYTTKERKSNGWENRNKYDIPENLEEAFDKEKTEARDRIERMRNEKHRRIRNIEDKLEHISKLKSKIETIKSYEKQVLKIVNEKA